MFVLNVKGTELLEQFIEESCVATGSAYFGLPNPKDKDYICTKSDYMDLWNELSHRDGVISRKDDDPVAARSGSESTYFQMLGKDISETLLPVNMIVLPNAETVAQWVMSTNLMKALCDQGALGHVLNERTTRVNLFKQLLALIGAAQHQNTMMVELESYRKISVPLEF